ncbi:MAG: hypothetical protein PVF74_08275 [Anaerolineales bacterium]|jgi:hypothetical protein
MENILAILQTIGICVTAIALTLMLVMFFVFWSTFFPVLASEDVEDDLYIDEEEQEAPRERKRGRRKR